MSDYTFFSKDPKWWQEAFQSLWGHHDICPTLEQFHAVSITQSELSSLTSLGAWGNLEKFKSDVTFLLILTGECAMGDKVFGLSTMWVHLYQARVPTMEDAIKQLTPVLSTGPDWPYALVWLNQDACHMPLAREGHLSILVEGGTSSATCRRVSQLEVCQLLSLGSQVIYLVGLNGCEVPMIASLCESLTKGANLLGGKPIYLKVDILQSLAEGPELKVPPAGSHSSPILIASPIRAPPPKADGEVSMTMEVRELLSWAVLDMSEHTSGNSTPKRLEPVVLVTLLPTKLEDYPWPVDTSSQASAPDDAEMEDASPEEIPAASSPTAKTPGPSGDAPPIDMAHVWEQANKALGDLLAIKSTVGANWWKLVSEFGITLHQNDSKTTESIKEAKTLCTHSIQEAETHCSTAIREAEAWGASQAGSLQQSHTKTIQHLEEAIKEESKGQLNFLSICQATLQASPPKFHGMLVASYHILLGHVLTSHLLSISQGASPSQQGSIPGASSPPAPEHSPRPQQWCHSPDPMDVFPPSGTTSKATPKGPLVQSSER